MPLQFKNLNVEYRLSGAEDNKITALNNVSLKINEGECVSIVGESGSGKTTLALASMKLLSQNAIMTGSVVINGVDTNRLSCFRIMGTC